MTGAVLALVVLLADAPQVLRTPDLTCRVRDKDGYLVRSRSRRNLFRRMTGYPNGRPGYVVDHLVPLALGGCDVPSAMTWLTVEEWRAKSSWERRDPPSWWNGHYTRMIQAGVDRAKEKR